MDHLGGLVADRMRTIGKGLYYAFSLKQCPTLGSWSGLNRERTDCILYFLIQTKRRQAVLEGEHMLCKRHSLMTVGDS
jgi:hypothetical protein